MTTLTAIGAAEPNEIKNESFWTKTHIGKFATLFVPSTALLEQGKDPVLSLYPKVFSDYWNVSLRDLKKVERFSNHNYNPINDDIEAKLTWDLGGDSLIIRSTRGLGHVKFNSADYNLIQSYFGPVYIRPLG